MHKILTVIRHRYRNDRQRKSPRAIWKFSITTGKGLTALLVIGFTLISFYAAIQYAAIAYDLPSLDRIVIELDPESGLFLTPTRVLDKNSTILLAELEIPGVDRRYIPLDKANSEFLNDDVVNSTIASADPGFWQHGGFSMSGMNPEEHTTLAQRLVYSHLLSGEAATPRRALRERMLAAQITGRYGRKQVLEWYLNSAYYGHYAYGIEAASQTYFGKPANQLSLPEASLLAGVSLAPALNPWDSPDGAKALQLKVLEQMAIRGYVTPKVFQLAILVPLYYQDRKQIVAQEAPAFVQLAVNQAGDLIGKDRVERGGLIIRTTLDYPVQRETRCALIQQLSRLEQTSNQSSPCATASLLPSIPPGESYEVGIMAGSAIIIDPRRGEILAFIGDTRNGIEVADRRIHEASRVLLPGLSAVAFSQGFSPSSLVWDVPSSNLEDGITYHGPTTIRAMLANGFIAAAGHLYDQIGSASLDQLWQTTGLPKVDYSKGSIAPVSILSVARFFSILAAEGMANGLDGSAAAGIPDLVAVLQIWSGSGEKIFDAEEPESRAVISPQVTYLLTHILGDDAARSPTLGFPNIMQITCSVNQ
ncbi:MAG: hypothetical protein HGA28_04315 [Anaerolineaceae bacterium]|nr:hypothetical protein [Anaerolineaceae bacterium]